MDPLFISLEDVSVQIGAEPVLQNLSWRWERGQQWALTGDSGSGKTVLARVLSGLQHYQGRILTSFSDADHFPSAVQLVEQQHRFRDLSNRSDFYYQQRYQSFDAGTTGTVRKSLDGCADQSRLFSKAALTERLQLQTLLDEPLIQLSNGENKRLQIAQALLAEHELLVLDQPFTGLDAAGRKLLDELLGWLMQQGHPILLIGQARDIPTGITHVATLAKGKFSALENLADFRNRIRRQQPIAPEKKIPGTTDGIPADFSCAVQMRNVEITYEEKKILHGIQWEVNKGDCWSLSGPNGAGKSTLLSLITGDNPQAYANEIYLFDRRRGTGESIWDIKKRIGFLSPELHLYFDPSATCFQTVASGFFDTIGLFRMLSQDQERMVDEWFQYLDLSACKHRLLNQVPAGFQRLLLLARAMIKHPPLLVLDEPCQGLDGHHTEAVRQLIDTYCRQEGATLIFVSHYPEELPEVVNKFLRLEKGHMV